MKLTLDTLQKNKACVVLTAAWKPCVIKFGFVPITKIKDGIHLLWYPYTPNRAKLLRSKFRSLLLCGCLKHFTVPYAKSNSILAKASKCCCSCSASNMTFSLSSSHIGFHKGSGLELLYGTCISLLSKYIEGLCVWGFVLFALVPLILETSGSGMNLFLSQNKDSVNTKCKVELRGVLQGFV